MIFGYAKECVNEHGLLELREVTLSLTSAQLEQLAEFISATAKRIEDGSLRTGHLHASQMLSKQWLKDAGCDVIIINVGPSKTRTV